MLHAHDSMLARRERLEQALGRARRRLAVGRHDRPAALPARHRHAQRGRAAGRDRRLRPLPAPQAAGGLPRAWCRARTPPASGAARARSPRPAPSTPAGCWSRPPGTTASRRASQATLERRQRDQDPRAIDCAWRCQRRLYQRWQRLDVRARQTPHAVRGRRRPRALHLLLGARHRANHANPRLSRRREPDDSRNATTPARDRRYGQPTPDRPRPFLDSEPATKRWS